MEYKFFKASIEYSNGKMEYTHQPNPYSGVQPFSKDELVEKFKQFLDSAEVAIQAAKTPAPDVF